MSKNIEDQAIWDDLSEIAFDDRPAYSIGVDLSDGSRDRSVLMSAGRRSKVWDKIQRVRALPHGDAVIVCPDDHLDQYISMGVQPSQIITVSEMRRWPPSVDMNIHFDNIILFRVIRIPHFLSIPDSESYIHTYLPFCHHLFGGGQLCSRFSRLSLRS